MKNKTLIFIFIFVLNLPLLLQAQHIYDIWLSGDPAPQAKGKARPNGMQHFYAYRDRGAVKFLLWPKNGTQPEHSSYIKLENPEEFNIVVKGPKEQELQYSMRNEELGFPVEYDFKEEGFHNIFLIIKRKKNDTLFYHIARQERMNHSCRNGHKHVMVQMDPISYPEIAPLELIRHRQPFENFHGILESGMQIEFDVLFNGKPLPNATIAVTTQKGWEMEFKSDENGLVSFQLPNDYFSDFKELDKHKTHRFLISAKHFVEEDGSPVQYSTKMEFDYIPSKTLYQSKVWAWILFFGSLILISLAVYFVNRRKKKQHKYVY